MISGAGLDETVSFLDQFLALVLPKDCEIHKPSHSLDYFGFPE